MERNLPSADIWEEGGGKELAEKLRLLKDRDRLTTQLLSDYSGVPVGTLNKILSGATKDPSLKTVEKLARVFGMPMRYFCDTYPRGQTRAALMQREVDHPLLLTEQEYRLIWKLRRITSREREIIRHMVETFDDLYRPGQPARRVLPCYLPTCAEGEGTAVRSLTTRRIAVQDDEVSRAADFAVVIYGAALEPAYREGDVLGVVRRPARHDQIGVFNLAGKGFIRLYQRLRAGERLAALNRAVANIPVPPGIPLVCLGEVVGRLTLL